VACRWVSLLDNGSFDGCDGWTLSTRFANDSAQVWAEMGQGWLHLGTNHLCNTASASAIARIPPRDEFPDGAALVVTYRAAETGAVVANQYPPITVNLEARMRPLPPSATTTEYRECLTLSERPRLATVSLSVQTAGACMTSVWAELWVESVRLEADPNCP
jgi:hypothetical protein